jgi:hypothetical protein
MKCQEFKVSNASSSYSAIGTTRAMVLLSWEINYCFSDIWLKKTKCWELLADLWHPQAINNLARLFEICLIDLYKVWPDILIKINQDLNLHNKPHYQMVRT